jgi:hypothetical protein
MLDHKDTKSGWNLSNGKIFLLHQYASSAILVPDDCKPKGMPQASSIENDYSLHLINQARARINMSC